MKKILFTLSIAALLAVGCNSAQQTADQNSTSTTQTVSTTTNISNNTSNWQTYTDANLKYTVSYPVGWEYKVTTTVIKTNELVDFLPQNTHGPIISIASDSNLFKYTLEDFVKNDTLAKNAVRQNFNKPNAEQVITKDDTTITYFYRPSDKIVFQILYPSSDIGNPNQIVSPENQKIYDYMVDSFAY